MLYIEQVVAQGVNNDVVVDEDTILFMHDTTSWGGEDFAESEKIELNPQKW